MRISILAAFATTAFIAPPVVAQDDAPNAQGDVSLTIYNNSLGLVQDIRRLNIPRGRTRIEFPDVSSRIRAETLSFSADGTAIVEQNFDYDLLTPTKLMEKAVGSQVTLIRTNPATGAETRERATVLSTAGGVVVRIGNRIEVLRDDGLPVRAVFDKVPDNLRARPTLSVTLDSDRAGTRDASLRYLTPGFGWSADYVALYDETNNAIDMQGWVTLNNSTGTSYKNADVVLVAGDPTGSRSSRGRSTSFSPGMEAADREQLGDYYLYPISGRTTVANAQTKQVSFLDVQGVRAGKIYWFENYGFSSNKPQNVESRIGFSTSRDQGLGDALPAGTVRFYQRDKSGTPQFIGENRIGHTPMGSELSLKTGDAFDVLVETTVVSRNRITSDEWERSSRYRIIEPDGSTTTIESELPKTFYRTEMRYTITNAKREPVSVDLIQSGLGQGWWASDFRIPEESLPGEQINANQRKWTVPVPAEGKTVVTVTYETRD